MKRSLPGSLRPNDEYRYVRATAAILLNELARLVHEKQVKHFVAFYGIEQPVSGWVNDPVHQSAYLAETCANTLEDFNPDDARYEFFEQFDRAAVSISNLVMLLRAFDYVE